VSYIPKLIWYLQEDDGFKHLLELNFKNRFKNVALKLDERLLFDLKLIDSETVYPIQIGGKSFILFLRKRPVGGYECEVIDENKEEIPCLTNIPKNFGKPRANWDILMPVLMYGFLVILAILVALFSFKVYRMFF
jgi:hypothetical protein